jgi:putative endonuclease
MGVRNLVFEVEMGQYYIYILSSYTRTIYTGITNDLARRIAQHKQQVGSSVASKYKVARLVHFEAMSSVQDAIAREKEIKGWRREKKVKLIESLNPDWDDLGEELDLVRNSNRRAWLILRQRQDSSPPSVRGSVPGSLWGFGMTGSAVRASPVDRPARTATTRKSSRGSHRGESGTDCLCSPHRSWPSKNHETGQRLDRPCHL